MLRHLQDVLTPKTLAFKKGECVFTQGEKVNHIYFIAQGRIKLIRDTIEGTPIVIHVARTGDAVAEASLFSDKYHCSALVDVKSVVMALSKTVLLHYLQAHPKSMMNLIQQLTYQVRDLRMLNEIKSIYNAKEKVLTYLTSIHNQESDLSLKDMAQKIGMAHETFYRTLKTLENRGEISRDGVRIKLIHR